MSTDDTAMLGTAWGSGRQVSIQTEFDVYCFAHTNDFVQKHVILHVVREKKSDFPSDVLHVSFCLSLAFRLPRLGNHNRVRPKIDL